MLNLLTGEMEGFLQQPCDLAHLSSLFEQDNIAGKDFRQMYKVSIAA
jgi:hypothetical protein